MKLGTLLGDNKVVNALMLFDGIGLSSNELKLPLGGREGSVLGYWRMFLLGLFDGVVMGNNEVVGALGCFGGAELGDLFEASKVGVSLGDIVGDVLGLFDGAKLGDLLVLIYVGGPLVCDAVLEVELRLIDDGSNVVFRKRGHLLGDLLGLDLSIFLTWSEVNRSAITLLFILHNRLFSAM
jgi:hypothetical protein